MSRNSKTAQKRMKKKKTRYETLLARRKEGSNGWKSVRRRLDKLINKDVASETIVEK